jgi:hypothetical protein
MPLAAGSVRRRSTLLFYTVAPCLIRNILCELGVDSSETGGIATTSLIDV